VAHDRLLDLQRRVLDHRQLGQHGRRDRGAARLAEQQRRLRVDVDEHFLDRDLGRPMPRDDFGQVHEDHPQASGEARLRRS
jgi:hypothetical protein